jgi:hypothetical protein
MYTERLPKLLNLVFKLTSNSGATILYFDKDLKLFSLTAQSKWKCQKVAFVNTLILLFFLVRTIQAKLVNHVQFPFCYLILLGSTINYLGIIVSLLCPKESAYAYTQLYRFTVALSNNRRNNGIGLL